MSHAPDYVHPVRLTLGPRAYDLTTRALVLAVLDGSADVIGQATAALDRGADVLEVASVVDVATLQARFDCPVSVLLAAGAAEGPAAAARAGASLIDDRAGRFDACDL